MFHRSMRYWQFKSGWLTLILFYFWQLIIPSFNLAYHLQYLVNGLVDGLFLYFQNEDDTLFTTMFSGRLNNHSLSIYLSTGIDDSIKCVLTLYINQEYQRILLALCCSYMLWIQNLLVHDMYLIEHLCFIIACIYTYSFYFITALWQEAILAPNIRHRLSSSDTASMWYGLYLILTFKSSTISGR